MSSVGATIRAVTVPTLDLLRAILIPIIGTVRSVGVAATAAAGLDDHVTHVIELLLLALVFRFGARHPQPRSAPAGFGYDVAYTTAAASRRCAQVNFGQVSISDNGKAVAERYYHTVRPKEVRSLCCWIV